MKKAYYNKMKAAAREKAQRWQEIASRKSLSYMALMKAGQYFQKIGRKYGLIREFKENAII